MAKNEQVKVLLHSASENKYPQIYQTLIKNNYDVHVVSYLAEIHDRKLLNQFQIVISSLDSHKKTNGIEFLTSVLHIDPTVQRVLIINEADNLVKLETAVNKAHINYLLFYPFDDKKFLKILKKATRRFHELTKPLINYEYLVHYTQNLRENIEKYRHDASTDSLTRLMNRRAFDSLIDRIWKRYKENKTSFSLAILDLDHFKKVNDEFGHPAGDMVLRKIGEIILGNLRIGVDYGSRYGGEEFAIISLQTDHKNMTLYLNRILDAVRNSEIETDKGVVKVTFSAGVAQADYFKTVKNVIKNADEALYRAKENGRNMVFDSHK